MYEPNSLHYPEVEVTTSGPNPPIINQQQYTTTAANTINNNNSNRSSGIIGDGKPRNNKHNLTNNVDNKVHDSTWATSYGGYINNNKKQLAATSTAANTAATLRRPTDSPKRVLPANKTKDAALTFPEKIMNMMNYATEEKTKSQKFA